MMQEAQRSVSLGKDLQQVTTHQPGGRVETGSQEPLIECHASSWLMRTEKSGERAMYADVGACIMSQIDLKRKKEGHE